ncbi:MAG: hypothetical protein WC955_02210 [Elusimicrobiota bacterium]
MKFRRKLLLLILITLIPVNVYSLGSTPTVTIDSIVGSSGTIRVNYTAYDTDGDSVTTTEWQYSRDNVNWNDISEDTIRNNYYKTPGTSYVNWVSTLFLSGFYDDSMWFRMKVVDNSGNGDINNFVYSLNKVPIPSYGHNAVVNKNRIYLIGGNSNSGHLDTVYNTTINSDGNIGEWFLSANRIPQESCLHSSTLYNNYLYVTGGEPYGNDNVFYTKIHDDGSISSFQTSAHKIPTGVMGHSCVAYNGYLYIIGGLDSNVHAVDKIYYAKINNSNGSIQDFQTSTITLPIPLYYLSGTVYNGYVYITGGKNNSVNSFKVYYARLSDDGSIGSFNEANSMAIEQHSSVIYNDCLYLVGGGRIYYAKINNSGVLNTFAIITSTISLQQAFCIAKNNKIYVVGGYISSNLYPSDTVYYANIQSGLVTQDYSNTFSLLINNNDSPIVTLNASTGIQTTSDINISYTITDTFADNLSLYCEYSTDGGANWIRATVNGTTSYYNVVSASGTVIWKSQVDLGVSVSTFTVRFRITPSDSQILGTPVSTSDFGVDNRHNPILTISGISDNMKEPSGVIKISYTSVDPDGNNLQTSNWQYSRDNVTWYDISSSAITNNELKPLGASYILWNTQSGTNNLNLVEDASVWYRMKLTDGVFYSCYQTTGPFAVDNYVKPVITLSNISGEVTSNTITFNYTITAAPDENLSLLCEYSANNGTDWSPAIINSSTYNITSGQFSGNLVWNCVGNISSGTDNSNIYFRVTPYGRALGLATTSNLIHVDYNTPPAVVVNDIFSVVRDTVAITYTLSDTNNDVLSIVCQYSTNGGSTWKPATVVGSTANIDSSHYSGSLVWYSNLDEPNINVTTTKFKIVPYDNDQGTADDTINFQVENVAEPPSVTITSVEGTNGTIKINYTVSDPDPGEQVTTTKWQYSTTSSTGPWYDIDSEYISNNFYKPVGTSYIQWNSLVALNGVYDDSIWFKMKVVDNSGNGSIGNFSTSTNVIPVGVNGHSSVVYNGYLYITAGNMIYCANLNTDGNVGSFITTSSTSMPTSYSHHSSVVYNGYLYITARNTVYYAKLNTEGSIGSFSTSPNLIPTSLGYHSSVVNNGYLYITGGNNGSILNTIYYAKINCDGSIASFQTNSNTIPSHLDRHSSVVYNGYLYITGGNGGISLLNTVYYAKLNADGSVESFNISSNTIPTSLFAHSSVVNNGYLYVTGGCIGVPTNLNTVYLAKLNADGSIGSFSTLPNTIPTSLYDHSSVVNNGYLYITGGRNSEHDGVGFNTMYYSAFTNLTSGYVISSSFPIDNTDETSPTVPSYIWDGTGADVDTTLSLTTLSANWGTSYDPESGISKYWYAIGLTQGTTDFVEWTDVGLSTYVVKTELTLSLGTTYYFSVKSENGSGLQSTATVSDGILIIGDITQPTRPSYIWDGLGNDIDLSVSTTTLSANWGTSSDPESGIAKYWYAIGTTPGTTDYLDWTDIGLSTYVIRTGLNLNFGTTYYFTVKSENGAGLQSSFRVSDGICVILISTGSNPVDLTPPATPLITSTTHPEHDTTYANSFARFTFTMPKSDESGIRGYYYLLNGNSSTSVIPETGIFVTWDTITLSNLTDGVLYLHAIAIDNAGNWSSANTAHYKFTVRLTIDPAQDTALVYSDGLKIDVPAGTVAGTTKLEVTRPDIINLPRVINDPQVKDTNIVVEIKFTDGTTELAKDITISIPYTANDIPGLDEKNLRVFYWHETKNGWVLIPDSHVDTAAKNVIARVNHLSLFKVMEYIQGENTIENLSNYPNPFKAGNDATKIRYILQNDSNVKIRIYDLIGDCVWEQNVVAGTVGSSLAGPNEVYWDGRNSAGDIVDIGSYICVVEASGVVLKTRIGVK